MRRASNLFASACGVLAMIALPGAALADQRPLAVARPGDRLGPEAPIRFGSAGPSQLPSAATMAAPSSANRLHDWLAERGLDWKKLTAASSDASATRLVSSDFPIANYPDNATVTEDLDYASVVYNPKQGQYLVVWQAFTRATSFDIYGRRLSSSGTPIGSPFLICGADGPQIVPHVAYESSYDTYWVTWTDFRTGDVPDVYIRRLTNAGVPFGSEIVANLGANQAFASRIACSSLHCVVTWQNVPTPDDGNSHTLVVGYDRAGNTYTPILLLSDGVGVAAEPDICYNPHDQHFAVAWQRDNGSNWDVSMFRLTESLAAAGWGPVSTATGNQRRVRITYGAGAGRYLLTWEDSRSLQTWDIYGQLVNRDGSNYGSALPIYTGTFHDLRPMPAGSSSSSEFVVAFQRDISGAAQFEIYGVRVSGSGSLGSAFVIRIWYNDRWTPAIVQRSGTTDYLSAWTDNGSATQTDIQAQRFSSNGSMAGGLVNVALGRKGQERPAVGYSPAWDDHLVVWADYRSGNDYKIYGRRVSSSGVLLGNEFLIGSAHNLYGNPELAYDPNMGEFLVVWQEVASPQAGYEIYGQRVSPTGDLHGFNFLISRDTNAGNEGGSQKVIFNSVAREYLVLWHAFTDGLWRIWGQRVSESGSLIGSNFTVSASSGWAIYPRADHNPDRNEIVVVWIDRRNDRSDVYAQRLSGNGTKLGGNFAISTATGNKNLPDIAYNARDKNYLVVWEDTRYGDADVAGQVLDDEANLVGENFGITYLPLYEESPHVIWEPVSGEFLTTWSEFHDATDYDIWAHTVSGAGTPTGSSFPIAEALEVQRHTDLAPTPSSGKVLIVWQDFRANTWDIYGRFWVSDKPPRARRFSGHH